MEIDRFTDPPQDETTNLGKVDHEEKKAGNFPMTSRFGGAF